MKRRIQHILVLALLANLGLILFQAYWLRSNFLINQADFKKGIQEGLEEAVEQMMFGETRALILLGDSLDHAHIPQDSLTKKNIRISDFSFTSSNEAIGHIRESFPAIQLDTLKSNITISTFVQLEDSTSIAGSKRAVRLNSNTNPIVLPEAQSFVEKVFMSILDDNLNLQKLDSIYALELNKRLLQSHYQLELFKADSLIDSRLSEVPFKKAYTIKAQTGILPLGYQIQANFPRQTLFLLKKMGFSIGISLLLIGIMVGSFLYMLQIIFKQKQLAEVKNDFINNMTHELKTPISILSTANEALLNFKGLEDKQKTVRYLGIFQKELDRLTNMVEKVLNIAVYEKDTFSLNKETVNVEEMINDLIQHHQVPRQKPVHIDFDNQLHNPILKLDRIHFYNVLNNILDNAIKYSKAEVQIEIKAKETDHNILLEIQDQGIGIPKAHQKSIFDKFYRVPTGNLHNVKGFGLGLHYVKQIIEKHQGDISLDSEIDHGTTFKISLPRV